MTQDNYFMSEAIKEAQKSLDEGGIPIGAVLVKDNEIISRGHNRLIMKITLNVHYTPLYLHVLCVPEP